MDDDVEFKHTCVSCGYTAGSEEFIDEDSLHAEAAGVFFCPECGHDDWGDQ